MADAKKELILAALEARLRTIIAGPTYNNTVSYVDRQLFEFEEEMIAEHPKPWIIINNDREEFGPFPGFHFENKLSVDIVAFIAATETNKNLDTVMNNLQKDIIVALLSDPTLNGTCAQIVPENIYVSDQIVYPDGAFILSIAITYTFRGTQF